MSKWLRFFIRAFVLKSDTMKENPFTSPETTAEPVAADQSKTLSGRGFEIAHNVFRGLLAFIFIGLLPVLIVPQFKLSLIHI